MRNFIFLISLFCGLSFLTGCGGGSGGDNENVGDDNPPDNTLIKGQLIDSPIAGVAYICGDGEGGTTTITGEFSCKIPPVTFKIGNLVLGTINAFTADNKVYPQDLVGVGRDNFNDAKLIKLVRLLQSLDADGVIETEIIVPPEVSTAFQSDANTINEMTLEELAQLAGVTLVSAEEAINHLKDSMGIEGNNPNTIKYPTYSHGLDGKELRISFCSYGISATFPNDPNQDSYAIGSLEVVFKDGYWAFGTFSNHMPFMFPYQYTPNRMLDLLELNDDGDIASIGILLEAIGGNFYQNINEEKIEDIYGFWSSKEKFEAYADAVTAKVQRTCEITPGPDLQL